ncbi:hypothetical protein BM221_001279 [Beauveria bassiana]|uniref:Uncharacterized protein n=1 Tax=Beauveria bassiana TaxID=176275 RepID=A0A2N6P2W3_BEABA|nr:hypothetical protein BM221_001279 [Beauveria bassiana]
MVSTLVGITWGKGWFQRAESLSKPMPLPAEEAEVAPKGGEGLDQQRLSKSRKYWQFLKELESYIAQVIVYHSQR